MLEALVEIFQLLGSLKPSHIFIILAAIGFLIGVVAIYIWFREKAATENVKYKTMFEATTQGVVIVDLQKGVLLESNKAFNKMLGFSSEEVIGQKVGKFIAEESRPTYLKNREKANSKGNRTYELKLVHKDGSKIDAFVRSVTIKFDQGMGVLGATFISDITSQKATELELATYRDHLTELVDERTKALNDEIETRELIEIALRERESFFRALFDNAAVGISATNADGNYIQFNDLWAEMLGYERPEVDTLTPMDITHPDDRADSWNKLQKLINGDLESYRIEKRYVRKDGSILWGDLSVAPIKDAKGNINATMAVCVDITERKDAEAALEKTSAQLKLTLDHIPGSLFQTDKDNTIIRTNDLFYKLFQFPVGIGEVGSPVRDLYGFMAERGDLGEGDVEDLVDQAMQAFRNGKVAVYERQIPNGTTLELRRSPTEDGGVLIISVDITDRKKAEAELARQTDMLQTVMSSIDQGIVLTDSDHRVKLYNKRLEKLSRFKEGYLSSLPTFEEVTKHWYELNGQSEDSLAVALEDLRRNRYEMFEVAANDATLEIRNSPLPDGGFVRTFTDITERKKAEQAILNASQAAEAATKAKSDFLANMSHEIRTPLNAVLGLNYLAQQTDLNPQQKEYLHKMSVASKTLLGIINDILDFSKIEAGKMELEKVEFSLGEVLHNLSAMMLPKAEEKGLELIFSVAPDVPYTLIGDSLRLSQILINLINNAFKFTDHGEVIVDVRRMEDEGDETLLAFTVEDTGIGLTPDQIDRLFESFTQADESTTRKYGGTGLGLTISKNLAKMMGGEIGVKSSHGKGSLFFFTAKFKYEEVVDRKALVPETLAGGSVLLVDDNVAALKTLFDMFDNLDFKVETARSGKEALEIFERRKEAEGFDLIISDWQMPKMDGIALLTALQKQTVVGTNTRYGLMVSGEKKAEAEQKIKDLPLNGFLVKPLEPESLIDSLMSISAEWCPVTEDTDQRPNKQEMVQKIVGTRVLLVEDNEVNQLVACGILEDAGLQVVVANNGQEAVDLIMVDDKAGGFEVVLMDLQMPVMDGFEATAKIREKFDSDALPIIAMTAHALDEEKQKCMEAGMNDHVAKPVDPPVLFASLVRWVKEKDQQPVMEKSENKQEVDSGEWPSVLPGLDVALGLARLNNNRKSYSKILQLFKKDKAPAIEQICNAIEEGDMVEAKALAHSLKGVAGNVAANDLFEAAKNLDNALKEEREDDLEGLLSLTSEAFITTISSIDRLLSWGLDEKEDLAPLISELHGLLVRNNLMAKMKYNELKGKLEKGAFKGELKTIEGKLARLDLKGAVLPLAKIAKSLNISLN